MSNRLSGNNSNGTSHEGTKLLLPIYNNSNIKAKYNLNTNKYNKRYLTKLIKKKKNVLVYVYLLVVTIWLYTMAYYEVNFVNNTINKCNNNEVKDDENNSNDNVNLLVFGDVQIMDKHSYPGRLSIVNWLTMKVLDNYHVKNWKATQRIIKPDYNLFMGDLFDGGRYWGDSYWYKEFDRFQDIFYQINTGAKNVFNLAGNHDIGFGETVLKESFERFNKYFGSTNKRIEIANTNTVIYIIDTIALSDTDSVEIQGNVLDYLKEIETLHPKLENEKRILMTHVPLYRDPLVQTCGSHRESTKPFPIMKGDQYQTVIEDELSQLVLNSVKPDLVLSGDDHDYCEIEHTYNGGDSKVIEITTKSAAMNMGIKKPELTYLTISPDNKITFKQCALPDPFKPFYVYILLAIISLIWVGYVTFVNKEIDDTSETPSNQKLEKLFIYGDKRKMKHLFDSKKQKIGLFFYRVGVISLIVFYFYIGYY